MSSDSGFHSSSILWEDGQFIEPHHFQCLERQHRVALHQSESWSTPYHFGLYSIEIDNSALESRRLVLNSCHCRLKDGTVLRIPDEHHVAEISIPESALSANRQIIRVFIGVAELDATASNIDSTDDARSTRYSRDPGHRIPDENSTDNIRHLDFRRLNVKLLLGEESCEGYSTIPVFQLKLSAGPTSVLQIDPDYFPPCLRQEAWVRIKQQTDRAFTYLTNNASHVSEQLRIAETPGENHLKRVSLLAMNLHALNIASGCIGAVALTQGVHPFEVYREFCRAAGSVACCREQQHLEKLPEYNHEDFAPVFRRLIQLLETDYIGLPYIREPFQVREHITTDGEPVEVLVCRLRDEWKQDNREFFIGVRSSLTENRIDSILLGNELDMKVGGIEAIDDIFQHGKHGLRLDRAVTLPFTMAERDWHFFTIHRAGDSEAEWERIKNRLDNNYEALLAIRHNRHDVPSTRAGGNEVRVKDKKLNEEVLLEFWLYIHQPRA